MDSAKATGSNLSSMLKRRIAASSPGEMFFNKIISSDEVRILTPSRNHIIVRTDLNGFDIYTLNPS